MIEFFVYPLTASSSDKATIEKFADVYLNNGHSVKELSRATSPRMNSSPIAPDSRCQVSGRVDYRGYTPRGAPL